MGSARADPSCFLIRAVIVGHTPAQAEQLAARCPGWKTAPPAAIDVFATACARLYDQIAREDPRPFTHDLADAARAWAGHRLGHQARRDRRRRQAMA